MNKFIVKYNNIKRTFKHNRALIQLAKDNGVFFYSFYLHDIDKILAMLIFPRKRVSKWHKSRSKHHNPTHFKHYIEQVLDWECSRFTKKDSPMTSREYLEYIRRDLPKETYIKYTKLLDILDF